MGCGKLVAIDYGLAAEEFLVPERKDGTLRAYYRHRLVSDVLANAGEQDLTAHINFSAIRQAGEAAGLRTEAFLTQEQFLTQIAAKAWKGGGAFGEWSRERTRQFQTLTHPEHLGRAFRVLVQSIIG
jgi:SAM-dependent MidA family methyltransferase